GTFIRSIHALAPYFKEMAEASVRCSRSPGELFSELRPIGQRAETAMLKATGGINTHKGQIFSLGLAVGAGCSLKRRGELSSELLSQSIAHMAQGMSERELKCKIESTTHGEKMYDAYGVTGIRGEAEKGFPAAFKVGLPVYEEALNSGIDDNSALIKTIVSIMAVLEDSNVYRRGGSYSAEWVKKTASCLMANGMSLNKIPLSQIREFDEEMIRRNLSPGGAADMLALTVFVHNFIGS
ncbi:MAG: triphosphoribosyl-dephospho-CoA synthase, partial [Clostridiales bacterium]